MRFIGNKAKLLTNIYYILEINNYLVGDRFFDFFAGTANVGRHFKEKGFKVISSDILFFSYVLQKAYIENTGEPVFDKLIEKIDRIGDIKLFNTNYEFVLRYLNGLEGKEGFIYKNYTEEGTSSGQYVRKFFKGENGKKIDVIRQQIENWKKDQLLNDQEYWILLATLIESVPFYANISGVYAAFLKNYDPRAKKKFLLRPIKLSSSGIKGKAFNVDSMKLIDKINTDILYLDPPYNERQYAPNYHLLETIAKNDKPKIKGVTGMRDYSNQKSDFCNSELAIKALEKIARKSKYKILVLSYNSEGIIPQKEIISILSKFGKVKLEEINYLRFKSNSNGESATKKHIKEQLYLLKRF